MKVEAASPYELDFIVARTNCALTSGARAIKATDERGRIRGMVAYDVWSENAVYAHMAVDAPIVWRSLIPAVFAYPFVECDRGVMLALIPNHNRKSWELAQRFGFTVKHVVRDGWAKGDDLLLLELRREDCRFLKN